IILSDLKDETFEVWGGQLRKYSFTELHLFLKVLEEIFKQRLFENDSYNLSLNSFLFSELELPCIQIIEKNLCKDYQIDSSKLLDRLKLELPSIELNTIINGLKDELAKL
ncbi:hypothetical protein MJH12_12820, partial [bacterium]|nr:hypothetical protein [bacterium]